MQNEKDKELSVMGQCLRLVSKVQTAKGRERVVAYLAASLGEMVDNPLPSDPRQQKPTIEPEVTGPTVGLSGASASSLGEHP